MEMNESAIISGVCGLNFQPQIPLIIADSFISISLFFSMLVAQFLRTVVNFSNSFNYFILLLSYKSFNGRSVSRIP